MLQLFMFLLQKIQTLDFLGFTSLRTQVLALLRWLQLQTCWVGTPMEVMLEVKVGMIWRLNAVERMRTHFG